MSLDNVKIILSISDNSDIDLHASDGPVRFREYMDSVCGLNKEFVDRVEETLLTRRRKTEHKMASRLELLDSVNKEFTAEKKEYAKLKKADVGLRDLPSTFKDEQAKLKAMLKESARNIILFASKQVISEEIIESVTCKMSEEVDVRNDMTRVHVKLLYV